MAQILIGSLCFHINYNTLKCYNKDESSYKPISFSLWVVDTGENEYKKHYIYLNEYTIYTVEDVSGANVSQYQYEVNFLPEMIKPVKITNNK